MKKNYFAGTLAAVVIIAACVPLFTKNCIGGHDIIYHLLRIEALKEGIKAGRPFLRINMLFLGGTGYASSMFYPDFLLYFPALLRACGVHINQAYHLFIALCVILGFLSSFYCSKLISKNDTAALATAVIFTLYQYHIFDIYARSAVGEFTAVIFLPFVIAGLYDLIYENFGKPWLLFAGMTGVALCHTITFVICIGFCVLMVLVGIKNLIKEPKKIVKLFLTALAVMGITAFYWLPALEILSSGVLSNDFVYNMELESVPLWELFFNEWNRMGAVIFVLLLIRLLIKNKLKYADICMCAGLFLAFCSTSLCPWGRAQSILGFIQFPWRLFVAAGPLLAFAEGIYISGLAGKIRCAEEAPKASEVIEESGKDTAAGEFTDRVLLVILTGIMLVSAFSNMQKNDWEYYSYSDDYFEYKPYTMDVLGGEWLPKKAEDRDRLALMSDSATDDSGREYGILRIKNELEVSGISPDAEYVDVPFVYYKGYAAADKETGKTLAVSDEGENGLVRVYTGGSESIRVWYAGTVLQHLSDIITMITLIVLIIYVFLAIRKVSVRSQGASEQIR